MKSIYGYIGERWYTGFAAGVGTFLYHFLTSKDVQSLESGIAVCCGMLVAVLSLHAWIQKTIKDWRKNP